MDNSVIIKGNKHGIVVVMDENIPFAELKVSLAEKFRSASKFLIRPIWQSLLKDVS